MEKKMPVLLTFDIDGETMWRVRDPENANRPVILGQGRYGPETGMPRILKLLDKYGIKATFFIPGFTADQYPDLVKEINEKGHELGNHGWSHTWPHKFETYEQEEEEDRACSDLLEKLTGKRPKGYRSPAWEFSKNTLDILEKMGDFVYSSNMMDTEEIRYLDTKLFPASGLVELPIHWVLDDAAYWLYSLYTPGKCMQPLSAVQDYWISEFDGVLEEYKEECAEKGQSDKCFVLTCHPQIIGRPARMKVLEALVKHMQETGDVRFMRCIDAAEEYKETH